MSGQVDFYNINYRHQYSTVTAPSQVVLASKGKVLSSLVYNNNAATRYLHLFDATAVPANGTAPTVATIAIPAGASVSVDFPGIGGFFMAHGITWACSTTPLTLTLSGASDFQITTVYATLAV